VKIEIDYDKCVASGACAQVAPEVFGLDDDGIIVVLDEDPGEDQRANVEEAAAACPACVILVEDA
jgi:ferredoxin